MSQRRDTDPVDDRLARLGREWFADVRRANPEQEPARKARKDLSVDGDDGGLLDWLMGDGDAAEAGGD